MNKKRLQRNDEPPKPGRPLSRRTTRAFVLIAAVLVLLVSFVTAYFIIQTGQDPEVQRLMETLSPTAPPAPIDSALTDTATVDSMQ